MPFLNADLSLQYIRKLAPIRGLPADIRQNAIDFCNFLIRSIRHPTKT